MSLHDNKQRIYKLNVQVKEIEVIGVNYIYEFISERECKTTTKIL